MILDDSCYKLDGFESAKYVFAPPARKQRDIKAITDAVTDGVVDTIGSDHCSFDMKGGKDAGKDDFSKIPNGIPGIETRPVLIATIGSDQKISPEHISDTLSGNAARIFGMYPKKGCLAEGSDADIVVWDPEYRGEITAAAQLQNVDYSPYEGMKVRGRADTVILNGEVAVSGGKVILENSGKYVFRRGCGR
jgi:dihydropyrimidinase